MKTLIKILCLSVLWFSCESSTEPEPDVYGCTDDTACNFNPDANIFDDSCNYIDLDEDGICDDIDDEIYTLRGKWLRIFVSDTIYDFHEIELMTTSQGDSIYISDLLHDVSTINEWTCLSTGNWEATDTTLSIEEITLEGDCNSPNNYTISYELYPDTLILYEQEETFLYERQ